ncbi:MAG: RluA family pseudouridine synthase [Clostridiales bacterium]|nr:RluA family pseudouridine synthase [Clostridiales bacterium]
MEQMTPEILFEDNHVIVAVKAAGVLSQADGTDAPDMLGLLKDYLKEKYNKPGNVYLGLVHRLDRNVEGVMVFARTDKAASRLSEQIRSGKTTKRYRAVVNGLFQQKEGRLEDIIRKVKTDQGFRAVIKSSITCNADKKAVLDYKVTGEGIYKGRDVSLVDIRLETGRFHQIRCQMSGASHPLLGDRKYGDRTFGDGKKICLQSYMIGFYHPVRNEYMEFQIPVKAETPWNIFTEE